MTTAATRSASATPPAPHAYNAQGAAMAAGIVFGLIGFLGFIPGVTTGFDFQTGQRFSGTGSTAMLFDVFQTSILHNGILLLFGIGGAVAAFFSLTARLYFFLAFVVFGFFAVYGFAVNEQSAANFLPMNAADNFLHLGIAVVALVIGVMLTLTRRR